MDTIVKNIESKTGFRFTKQDKDYVITGGSELSRARNEYRNKFTEVSVAKLFDNFWLYLRINSARISRDEYSTKTERDSYVEAMKETDLRIKDEFFRVNTSISVFEGTAEDRKKKQLFRAEWDNFDNKLHAQPHWQIHPVTSGDIDTFSHYVTSSAFENLVVPVNPNLGAIDIRRFHFAMSALWSTGGDASHRINSGDILVNWINGVINYIRDELKYCSERR